jgi:hypothetical protein
MKTKVIIMSFPLAALLALDVHAAWSVPGLGVNDAATPSPTRLAVLSENEMESLRQQWRHLPPEEREKLRRKLRDEHGEGKEDGYGTGFEFRRRDSGDSANDQDPDGRWGRPGAGDRRDNRKGRR